MLLMVKSFEQQSNVLQKHGILFPKLFLPHNTVKKNCSRDREKLLKTF